MERPAHLNKQTASPILKGKIPMPEFYEKSVYGRTLIYPAKNIEKVVERLIGKKTLDMEQLNCLSALGVKVGLTTLPGE